MVDRGSLSASKLKDQAWFDLAMREYEMHQESIHKFDAERRGVRNWAVTTAGAAFVAAVTQAQPLILAAALISTALFWWLECTYAFYEQGVFHRLKNLDEMVNAYISDEHGGGAGSEGPPEVMAPDQYTFGTAYAYRDPRDGEARNPLLHREFFRTVMRRWGALDHLHVFYLFLFSFITCGVLLGAFGVWGVEPPPEACCIEAG